MAYTKISDMKYERVSKKEAIAAMQDVIAKVEAAKSAEDLLAAREVCNAFGEKLATMTSLANTRFNCNTKDAFYEGEVSYYDEALPEVQMYNLKYMRAFLDSPYLAEAKKSLNPLVPKMFELNLKCADERILSLMQQENALVTKHSKFISELTYEFRGERMPLGTLRKFMMDSDRATRREAYEALGRTMENNREHFEGIFDELVRVRDTMAKTLGYENYVELGYNRMSRTCYDKDTVRVFRENVKQDIVPVVTRLKKKLADKLGIDQMKLYDNDTYFAVDPRPIPDAQGILDKGREMYHEMSPETAEFIDMMCESEAFDVLSREGKWTGGYMTAFPLYKQPFIFANFNGTTGDVDVITHEAGHAFAYFAGAPTMTPELDLGGMETAETHSMSMEFFAWPYMDKFFGDDERRYRYMHLFSGLCFIPYGTIVDYFQEEVYSHPEMTPAERNALWNRLEREFRPWLDTEGMPYLEEGTRWQYQNHIFASPFYYIDYCLAQTVAIEFLDLLLVDYKSAFATYLAHASRTGNYTFVELLRLAGLKSPFEKGALSEIAATCERLLSELE